MISDPQSLEIYKSIPGGEALINCIGCNNNFHDSQLIGLALYAELDSILLIRSILYKANLAKPSADNKRIDISLLLKGVIDIEIEGFSDQNIIYELLFRQAPFREERQPFYSLAASPSDFEIEIQASVGLSGRIRCQKVAIEYQSHPAD